MFREKLTTLDLNKPSEQERLAQLELSPEQLEKQQEIITEAQKDRVGIISRIIHHRIFDMALNLPPGIGDVKSVIETVLGKTLSREAKLSFSERLVWAASTAINLAGHVAAMKGRYDIMALAYGAKHVSGLATTVLLNKKELLAAVGKIAEYTRDLPQKTAELMREIGRTLEEIPEQIFYSLELDIQPAFDEAFKSMKYQTQPHNESR